MEIYKLSLKFRWKHKGPRVNGHNSFGDEKEDLHSPHSRLLIKLTVLQAVGLRGNQKQTDGPKQRL